ncbi:MAG TPA: hypothetical protein VKE96_04075 [Vicinamibacterales bacterium]|nr:hypothetical protein [Vicinamibacterales bacterium]
MDEKERRSAFLAALTTEHFTLQTAAVATVNESASRASIYILSLSSALVAIGFVSQSREAFGLFVASVLPGLFLLGLFTVTRLVDVSGEYMGCLGRIARIRNYYATLTPEAAEFFGPDLALSTGRSSIPALQLGRGIAFLTTTATTVACVNNIVAGASVALLVRWLLGSHRISLAISAGVASTVILTAAFLIYQRWRFSMFDSPVASEPSSAHPSAR